MFFAVYIFRYWSNKSNQREIPLGVGPYERRTINLMIGYLVYDFVVEIFTTEKLDILIILHHIVGLVSHFATLMANCGFSAFFTMAVYLAETSTPVLHSLWMMKELKLDETTLFLGVALLLLVLFFICRVVLSPILLYTFFATTEEYFKGTTAMYYGQMCVLIFFAVLNFVWFYQLVMLAVRVEEKSKSPRPEGEKIEDDKKVR